MWFTLASSVAATCECLLAVALTVWYSMSISPILYDCDREFVNGRSTSTCECSRGFIDPPSLERIVYRFRDVSDCESLGETLSFFHNVLLAMFVVGGALSILVAIFAIKRLNSLGVCGKSGVYVVTPEVEHSDPTPVSVSSQRPSPSFSHRSAAPSSTSQRYVYFNLSLINISESSNQRYFNGLKILVIIVVTIFIHFPPDLRPWNSVQPLESTNNN